MGPIDITGVAVALPAMGDDLGLSFSVGIWVSAAYLLTYTLALAPIGRIADHWGRLRLWRIGLVIFGGTSALIAATPDTTVLLALRGIQGIGAAILASTATALISAEFPPGERGRAIGINVTAIYLGLALGPIIGGALVAGFGWRWVFLVNIPVSLIALAIARPLEERRRVGTAPMRIDLPGVGLLAVGLTAGLVPLTFGPVWGWTAPGVFILETVAVVMLAGFALQQVRARDPLLPATLFRRNRLFLAASIAAFLNYVSMFGAIALTAVLLQVVGGRSALGAGVVLVVQPFFMVALSPLAGAASDRIGSRALVTGGMALIAIGLFGLAMVPESLPLHRIIVPMALVGIGMAGFSSPNTSAAMGVVSMDMLGIAAAVLATMRSLGQSVSMAALGGIAAHELGRDGGRVILGGDASGADATAYLSGYRTAMLVGSAIAVIGMFVSLTRGAKTAAPSA